MLSLIMKVKARKYGTYNRHNEVKKALVGVTKKCGAALNPVGLGYIVFKYLDKHHKANNNIETARNTAYLLACLCNEYGLMARFPSVQETDEFYMPEWKWHSKYLIGAKVRQRIKLLKEMGWIDFRIQGYSTIPHKRTLFKINVDKIYELQSQLPKSFKNEEVADDLGEMLFAQPKRRKTQIELMQEFLSGLQGGGNGTNQI